MKKTNNLFLMVITVFALLFIFVFLSSILYGCSNVAVNKNTDVNQEYIEPLEQMKRSEPKVKNIIVNIIEYPTDILDLLLRNAETIDFVLGYPERETKKEIELSSYDTAGEIPLFLQWDKRWGYDSYGDEMMALNGCGPTCLSMVAVGLTGNTSFNPRMVAEFSAEQGYLDEETGSTSWTLMSEGAEHFGLQATELNLDSSTIIKHLKNGNPIIVSVQKGDFTTTGHFIVLGRITSDVKILVNDPNSIERSNMEWDLEQIESQVRNLWAYSLIEN